MTEDRREFPCQVVSMSPGGAHVIASVSARLGDRVVAYVDHIGRLEGICVRVDDSGFAMSIDASLRKRDKIADQLTWLINRHMLGLPEDRRHPRVTPANPFVTVTTPDGEKVPMRVIDISLSGAAIHGAARVEPGDVVQVSRTMGRVVRRVERGFAVEFSNQQPVAAIVQLGQELGVVLAVPEQTLAALAL